ncbi:VOC family protein [Pseudohalocynthiibacter sp. F2068]
MTKMTFQPQNALVWAEIPVTNLPSAMEFYKTVFNYTLTIDDTGPNPIAILPTADGTGTAAHLYPGKPASDGTGATLHLAVPDALEPTVERFKKAGGEVLSPPVTIPVGRFVYGLDPDGNSIGMFEAA